MITLNLVNTTPILCAKCGGTVALRLGDGSVEIRQRGGERYTLLTVGVVWEKCGTWRSPQQGCCGHLNRIAAQPQPVAVATGSEQAVA